MTYIRASEIGCALDCDLEFGVNKHKGGSATDDGPRINAAMAGASASHPITLIIDGSALISGLFLPAGGHWSIAGLGCGTGFFVKTGTNNDGIHNGGPNAAVPTEPGPPVPARGSNVSLSNFTLNGNGSNGGDSTTGLRQGDDARKVWYFGINLMDLDNISVQNVVIVNTPAYHMRLSNVGKVTISGCVVKSTGLSTDGFHFDGPSNDISISKCDFTTGDDAIALNCPEGHMGNIARVSVDSCTFNSWSLMRLDSIQCSGCGGNYKIDTVSVTNCTGTLREAGFLIGQGAQASPESVTGLKISNCTLTAPAVLEIGANFGSIELDQVTLIPTKANLSSHFVPPGLAFARTSPYFYGCTYVGSSLTVNNCTIQRDADDAAAAVILDYGSSIANLSFNGFQVQDATGKSHPAVQGLLYVVAGSIGQLILNKLDSTNIQSASTAGQFSSIGVVSGAGVLATAFPFPDEIVADGVPYISATTHMPSIKVGGVVEPYP
jgi:hypothetical protein